MWISPCVGGVILDISLSAVLLPAPLWPIMPNASPRDTPKLTSRSAQNSALSRQKRVSFRKKLLAGALGLLLTRYLFDTDRNSKSNITPLQITSAMVASAVLKYR